MKKFVLASALVLASVSTASALETVPPAPNSADDMSSATLITGKCNNFTVGAKARSCSSILHNYYPKTNRQNFMLLTPEGAVSFSGLPIKASNSLRLHIDSIVLADKANPANPNRYLAEGACEIKQDTSRGLFSEIKCEAVADIQKVTLNFVSDGKPTSSIQSPGITKGVSTFDTVFRQSGILGVINASKQCYRTFSSNPSIHVAATCFSLDYTTSTAALGAKSRAGIKQNEYTLVAKVENRAHSALKRLGYDRSGIDRQMMDWKSKTVREMEINILKIEMWNRSNQSPSLIDR